MSWPKPVGWEDIGRVPLTGQSQHMGTGLTEDWDEVKQFRIKRVNPACVWQEHRMCWPS